MSEENGENRKLTLIHEMEFELNWSQLLTGCWIWTTGKYIYWIARH